MAKYKLGEICEVVSGGTPSRTKREFWHNGIIPWIKIGNIKGKYVREADEYITQAGLDGSSAKMLSSGTILYTIFATLGEVGILGMDACTNQAIAGIMVKDHSEVLTDYLYYYLKSKKPYVNELGRGVAQNNINMSILRSFEVPLPNLLSQQRIVEVLDRVSTVISSRQQQLQKLDELVKARFVEMFGDPITNTKGWKIEKAEKHIDLLSGFPFDSSQYTQYGVKICGGLIIMPQRIDWDSCKYWSSTEGLEEYTLQERDIVMALDRPWISEGFKIAMVDADELPALLIQRTARIRAVDINQYYLMHCFALGGFDSHCNVTGSLVPHISAKDIRSFPIMLPPIELQEQFAAFVEQVDKSKAAIQKSLDEAQLLFDSLMQKYFGGESYE